MQDKEAATILIGMLDSHQLSDEEKGAIKKAIGLLSWTCLSKSRMKNLKDKMNKKRMDLE